MARSYSGGGGYVGIETEWNGDMANWNGMETWLIGMEWRHSYPLLTVNFSVPKLAKSKSKSW